MLLKHLSEGGGIVFRLRICARRKVDLVHSAEIRHGSLEVVIGQESGVGAHQPHDLVKSIKLAGVASEAG